MSTKSNLYKRILCLALAIIMAFSCAPFSAMAAEDENHDHAAEAAAVESLAGKTISILGDSISTFAGVSNNTAYNSTIGSNAVYYTAGTQGIYQADTWWQQTIDALGLELCVNNSWSGSCVLQTRSGTVGGYVDRCVQLHNDKTGEEPDIIAVFLGINDFWNFQSTLGTADISYDSLIVDNGDGTFSYGEPTTTCEAYAIMLHKMTNRYPDADIYCMNMLPRREPASQPTAFNAELSKIIERFGCTVVDLENCGIPTSPNEGFDQYITDKSVHPGPLGMDKMTEALNQAIISNIAAATISLRYDDRYDVTGKSVEIIDAGTPTSYQVGYGVEENTVLDTAVVTLDGDKLIATGVGEAIVRIDGVTYNVTVETSPINLFLLIGQSNMQGIDGDASQSIACPDGQVYATYADRWNKTPEDVRRFAPSALTGQYRTVNVTGTTADLSNYPVYMLAEEGKGREGMDSGIAYEWNRQTGDKVWVVNMGYGGSSINAWQKGGTHYNNTLTVFSHCTETLRKEIAAGHFSLSHMGYFWCQGCADETQTAQWYAEKYQAMHESLKAEMAFDHDSDPSTPDAAFEFAGIIPIRSGHQGAGSYRAGTYTQTTSASYFTSFKDLRMNGPRVAQYWMGNNPELTDIWNVCTIQEAWATMPDGSDGVAESFEARYENGTVDYEPQVSQSAGWYKPTTPTAVHDNIHYNQIGYNEIGRESARNALINLGEIAAQEIEASVKFVTWDGFSIADTVATSGTGNADTLVIPMVSPVYLSKTISYTISDGLDYSFYDLTAQRPDASGTLKASVGDTCVTASPRAFSSYRWSFDGSGLKAQSGEGFADNEITKAGGTFADGVLNNQYYYMSQTAMLCHDKAWSVEWITDNWNTTQGSMILSAGTSTGGAYIYQRATDYFVGIGYYDNGIYHNYGIALKPLGLQLQDGGEHSFRLENRIDTDGSNQICLIVDGNDYGALTEHYKNSALTDNNTDWLSGQDFALSALGSSDFPLRGLVLGQLTVRETGADAGESNSYEGKTISILGDSISTYAGVSNNNAYNSTIGRNSVYYSAGTLGIYQADTWWRQTIDALGMELCVNNSWSGSCVLHTRSGTVGGYVDRCVQLHNDKTGEEPDVIAVFLGTNDFSYYQSSLGDANIDYSGLIQANGDGTFTYAAPTTTCEAYAVMLHKMKMRYPDAEIFCMTMLPRRNPNAVGTDVGQPTDFNAELTKVIQHFGCTVVDLENCGIPAQGTEFDLYITDRRVHPGPLGMDKMTEALASAMLGYETELVSVTAELNGVTGEVPAIALKGGSLNAQLELMESYENMSVTVTMGGEDITAAAYADGCVSIPSVTGDVVISARAALNKNPENYRWEFNGSGLASVGEDENSVALKAGSLSNGVYTNAYWQLSESVFLRHDRPWTVEWKCSGNWSGLLFSSAATVGTEGNRFLFRTYNSSGLLALGECSGGTYNNYGIALAETGLDMNLSHVYRIENRVSADGSNMAYLFVDGKEIGPLNNYYIAGTNNQNKTVDWVSGKDFAFNYLGASGHALNNIAIDYIAVWEDGKPAPDYSGKVISIMGDSISTFAGYIPTADGFNLEHLARYPQDDLLTDVNETWWMQIINRFDAKLGINDSWRGATVSGAHAVTTGSTGENAAMHNLTRIQNLGSNGTPDVILFYGGTNDLAHVSKVGTFDASTAPTEADLTTKKWDNLAEGYVHTLLRMKHYYPDAQIVCLLPTYTASYYTDAKLAQGNEVLAAICEHYGVPYVDLRDCGITTAELPDGIHPDAEGMDYITNAVIELMLAECEVESGENVVYSISHRLTCAESSKSYYKGISHGNSFVTTITGENLTVSVTMGGVDITADCYAEGVVNIPEVSGDIVITAEGEQKSIYGDYLLQLPDTFCENTNLWTILEHNREYYTITGWGVHSSGKVYSVTIPVSAGDRLWATSFQNKALNSGAVDGIRVTWFDAEGVLKSVSADAVYSEFAANGYLTAPEGAIAVNVPMWTNEDSNELYVLTAEHKYENGICVNCGVGKTIAWEQGTIDSKTGLNKDGDTRLRTVDSLAIRDYAGVGIGIGYTMTCLVYDDAGVYLGTTDFIGGGVSITTAALLERFPEADIFRVALRAVNPVTMTEADLEKTGIMFYAVGQDVPQTGILDYEDVMNIGSYQDGAVYDGKLFLLNASGTGAVYDLATEAKLGTLSLEDTDILKPHANSVCFGSEFYAAGDKFPLLYVNIYNNYASASDRLEGTCCVYRIVENASAYTAQLVQVIRIGFTEDLNLWKSKSDNGDVRPYGNFAVDTDEGKLYAFVMRDADSTTRFFSFDLPELSDGTYNETYGCNMVTLEAEDIESRFDTEYFNYLQGCIYHEGKLISAEGVTASYYALRVVDLTSGKVEQVYTLNESGLTSEPEVVCADNSDGSIYYAAADGILRKLDLPGFDSNSFAGKVISILSASTSTFAGYIPVADGFNLEHRSRYPQDNLLTDVNETWWMRLINKLDAKLGINDSWAGSQVLNTLDTNSGDLGPDAAMASMTRIRNLGANGNPDVILFFGAGNDIGRGVAMGSFDPATAPTEVDLTTTKWDTLADAYVAAIMRLQHTYPDAQIVAMTTYAMPSYATTAKLDKYGPMIKSICEHYGVPYVDLRESGVTFDMLPDSIHPDAEGMALITEAVLHKLVSDIPMEPGENVVYTVSHELSSAKASLGYYKGVSAGESFVETLSGDELTVTVTMGGEDITANVYKNGEVNIPSVTGDVVITAKAAFNADGHLQPLPEEMCSGVNLWTALEPENIYYTVDGWGLYSDSPDVHSITFPVESGERVWASSFQKAGQNGASANATRITWFMADGSVNSIDRNTVYNEFAANGYITVPEGAIALNVPAITGENTYKVYLLDRTHSYENGFCSICGAVSPEGITLRYDDRFDISGKTVEIIDSDISPEGIAVLSRENDILRATAVGSATVVIDGVTMDITVEKAKINLVMIMGQSNAGNHFENATSGVVCPPGTAYRWKYGATAPEDYTEPSMGFHTPLLAELYAQSVAKGDPVKNVLLWQEGFTSKNGKSITAWAEENENGISTNGTAGAAKMVKNCIAYYEQHSDCYEIVSKGVYWLQGESDLEMDPQRYISLFTAMWERLKREGMEYVAFLRVRGSTKTNTSRNDDVYYSASAAAQFEMVRSRKDMFMASTITENWTGPADTSYSIDVGNYLTVVDTYGKSAEYSDSYGNKASYNNGILTTTMKELYGSNNRCHYGLFGYGLIGADAAYNMFKVLSGGSLTFVQTDSSGLKSAETIDWPGDSRALNIDGMEHNLSFYPGCASPAGTMSIKVMSGGEDITEKVISKAVSDYGTVDVAALRTYVEPTITVSYIHGGVTESVDYVIEHEHPCKDGHSYNSTVTPPTCTEQGYTTYTCTVCGNNYVDNYVDPRPLNILMIGNSFSWDAADFWYDMQESMTYDAMKSMLADPYDVHLAVMYKGSATLAYHATCAMNNTAAYTYTEIGPETNYKWTPSSGQNANNDILNQLEAREWDIIVIQSYQHEADGTEPRSTYTGGDARFVEPEASVGYLLDYFAEHEPNAEVYYYMPWASTKFYGNDTETGYQAIAEYTQNRVPYLTGANSGKQFAGIIPVGTGIQNARTTYFDALQFSSGNGSTALLKDPQNGLQYDSQHLSFGIGRYIAGAVVAETLIPQAMRKESYPLPGVKDSPAVGALPQEYTTIAQLAAENAVASPYQATVLTGYETDLADRICDAIEIGNYITEGIADEAALLEYLQTAVDRYLENAGAAKAEITLNSFVLENGKVKDLDASVSLRIGYTERTARIDATDGQSHNFGDWVHVTVPSADTLGIDSRTCVVCGFTQTVEVEGSWQKYNLAQHLQELPEEFCCETNLWSVLKPETLMIDHLGKWVNAGATVYSVTIPVAPGDKIYANSFDQTGTTKGIQVSFIGDYGIIKTTFSSDTYKEFHENGGYLIAPEGAIAVNIPVWNVNADNNIINIMNASHIYDVIVTPPTCTEQGYTTHTCTSCGDSYTDSYTDPRPLNILMIGNSFTWDAADIGYGIQQSQMYEAMRSMLADGCSVQIGALVKGSSTLGYHATCAKNGTAQYKYAEIGPDTGYVWNPSNGGTESNSILSILEKEDWDIITVQAYEHEADNGTPKSGSYVGGAAEFIAPADSIPYLLDYFAEHEPGAEIYYYMPWASTKFYGLEGTAAGFEGIAAYTEANVMSYSGAESGKSFVGVIPVGTGIENARGSYLHELSYGTGYGGNRPDLDIQVGLLRDNQHVSFGIGRYIAGNIMAEILIPDEMREDSYTVPGIKDSAAVGPMPEEYTEIAKKAVEAALSNPYSVTAIAGYETEPAVAVIEKIEQLSPDLSSIRTEAELKAALKEAVQTALNKQGFAAPDVTIENSTFSAGGELESFHASVKLRFGYTTSVSELVKHNYTSIVTAPTCTEGGYTTHTCTVCVDSYTDSETAALGHSEVIDAAAAPNCSETGLSEGKHCFVCGEVLVKQEVMAALGHSEVNDAAVAATCTETGLTEGKHCDLCGKVLVKQEVVAAKGHTYTNITTAPTCTAQGYTTYTCACGESYVDNYVPATGHKAVSDAAVAPGCTETGLTAGTHCSVCGEVIKAQEVVPATDHKWDKGTVTKPATESTEGVMSYKCTVCSTAKTAAIPVLGHTHKYEATVTAPTCSAQGFTTYTCTCGETYVDNYVPSTGHKAVNDAAVAPGCTETGLSAGTHCSVCGVVIKAQEIVPATGHKWDKGTVTKPATEKLEGVMTYKCAVCGTAKTAAIPVLGHTHKYDATVTSPTCTAQGYTTFTCTCGETYVDNYVPSTGHKAVSDAAVAPGCTDTGLTAGTHCSVCGEVIKAQEVVPATGHKWDKGTVTKPATEKLEGVKTFTCTVCGETKPQTIPVLDHTHSYSSTVKAPTCSEGGYTTYTCSCGEHYTGSNTPANGHKWDNGKVTKEPSTDAEGEKTFTCTVCAETMTEKIDKLPDDSKPEDPKPVNNPFKDISEKDYYFEPVMWAVRNGVTNGLSADSFGPAVGCTRAQVVTFLWRTAGEPAPKSSENPFKDISEGQYYYDAVLWAVENGITTGLSTDTFGPNINCTRGHIVTFLWRAMGKPTPTNSSIPFVDVPEDQYYYDAVLWAVEKGITTGMSANSFAPNATCTRGQIVTFLYRAYAG